MNKKGMMMWEIIVGVIILLVVAGIVIFLFKNLSGEQGSVISDNIATTKADFDKDGIKDAIDRCIEIPPTGESVDWTGCSPSQRNKK